MEIYVSNIKLSLLLVQEVLLTSASINFLFFFFAQFSSLCACSKVISAGVSCVEGAHNRNDCYFKSGVNVCFI